LQAENGRISFGEGQWQLTPKQAVIKARQSEVSVPIALSVFQVSTSLDTDGVTTRVGKQIGNKETITCKFRAGAPTKLILQSPSPKISSESVQIGDVVNNEYLPELVFVCEDEWGHISAPTTSDEHEWCVVWDPAGCLSTGSALGTDGAESSQAVSKIPVSGTGKAIIPRLQVSADDDVIGISGRLRTEKFYLDVSGGKTFASEGVVGLVNANAPSELVSFFVMPSNIPSSIAVRTLNLAYG
jgi:hypothetical protein